MYMKAKSLRRLWDAKCRELGPQAGRQFMHHHIQEGLDKGDWKPDDFSLRDLFTHFVDDGTELLNDFNRARTHPGYNVTEAAHAVDTSTFANIQGQLAFSAVRDSMQMDEMIGDQLCTIFPSVFQGSELVPGISAVSDEFNDEITEGDPYPLVGMSEEDIKLPRAEKRGGILGITREAIVGDRTGLLLQRARTVGQGLGIRREKSIMDVAIGAVNPYIRKGEARNTYANLGMGFDNIIQDGLQDYTDLQAAGELFYAMRDPNTGEPLGHSPTTILCSKNLEWTARAVIRDTTVGLWDALARAANIKEIGSFGANRIPWTLKILANEWYLDRMLAGHGKGGLTSNSRALCNEHWYIGKPTEAFVWKEIWGLTTEEAPSNNEAQFTQDIWFRIKVSYKGVAGVLEPRLMIRSDGTNP